MDDEQTLLPHERAPLANGFRRGTWVGGHAKPPQGHPAALEPRWAALHTGRRKSARKAGQNPLRNSMSAVQSGYLALFGTSAACEGVHRALQSGQPVTRELLYRCGRGTAAPASPTAPPSPNRVALTPSGTSPTVPGPAVACNHTSFLRGVCFGYHPGPPASVLPTSPTTVSNSPPPACQ